MSISRIAAFVVAVSLIVGVSRSASADDVSHLQGAHSTAPDSDVSRMQKTYMRKIGVAFAVGQCEVVFQYGTTQSGVVGGSENADNATRLHECEYIEELAADQCIDKGRCPTYAAWSKANPDFTPSTPAAVFFETLAERRRRFFPSGSATQYMRFKVSP